ncbi:MFS transporter [Methanobrevibacter sp.]|uniref:MFS transporter n=1 Tax=Methanobrevibacter sp. TaxID=66852 RepID=UPI00388FE05A
MMENRKTNICCYLLFGLLFIIMLTVYGYGVYFLKNLGLSYVDIGTTIAISALLASILQPILGRIADTYHYPWQRILLILNLILIISILSMFILPNNHSYLMFALMIIASGCMYPFITYSPFYYEHHGIKTNFGVARGFGSLTFTVFALIIGFALRDMNFMVIPLFSLASSIMMMIIICLLPDYGYKDNFEKRDFRKNIFSKYPVFTLFLVSLIFLMTFQNLFECYMINIIENVGGNISNVGISNSLAAVLELPVMFIFIKILDKADAKKLIIIASLFYIVRSIMICFAQDIVIIYLSQILQMLTFALIVPASVHLTNDMIEDNDQYEAQAFLGATVTVGLIFANFIGGNVLQLYGIDVLLQVLVLLTVLGSVFALITLAFNDKFKHLE